MAAQTTTPRFSLQPCFWPLGLFALLSRPYGRQLTYKPAMPSRQPVIWRPLQPHLISGAAVVVLVAADVYEIYRQALYSSLVTLDLLR